MQNIALFTEEKILNGKLHILCSVYSSLDKDDELFLWNG